MSSICGNLQMFLLFTMILYCRIQLPVVYKQRDLRWCSFRWSIPPSIDYVSSSSIARLSLLLHAHIAYEIDTAKIIAAFCRISYWLYDLIRVNSLVCHVRTTRYTMMSFSMIDSDINWLCLKCVYWQGYLDSLILILHIKLLFKKSPLITILMRKTISHADL